MGITANLTLNPLTGKPAFPSASVLKFLNSRVEAITHFAPISEGQESQAFFFRSGSQASVIRINRCREHFEKDALAHHLFARPDLPIPQVREIGPFEDSFFCISEHLPGRTLQDLPAEDLVSALPATARVLQSIEHSNIDVLSGWGRWDGSGAAAFESWRDFLRAIPNVQGAERITDRLHQLVSRCPEIRALIHGDFGSDNVLTDGIRITGVLDWSESKIGDPLYDVANLFFWSPHLTCMDEQARYFEMHVNQTPNLRDRLLCYQLHIGLAEAEQNASAGRNEEAEWALKRCEEILRSSQ